MTERDDIALEQATNPMLTSPMFLDEEALRPNPPPQSLADRLAKGKSTAEVLNENPGAPKRRGRPPGSKNRTTVEREASTVSPGQRISVPRSGGTAQKTKPTDGLTPEQRHEHKVRRAEKLGNDIAEAVNDNLMMVLMALGAPPELLYKPGQEPARNKESSKYTPLGAQLALGPMQASYMGRFLAEMETTDTGGKLGAALTDGKAPMILYGALSVIGAVQWSKGLLEAYKKFEPMLKAYQAQQAMREQQEFNQNQQTGG